MQLAQVGHADRILVIKWCRGNKYKMEVGIRW